MTMPELSAPARTCVGRGASACPTTPTFRVGDTYACVRHVAIVLDRAALSGPVSVVRLPPVAVEMAA